MKNQMPTVFHAFRILFVHVFVLKFSSKKYFKSAFLDKNRTIITFTGTFIWYYGT